MEELPINKCLECYEIVLAGWVREIFVEENGDKQGLTAKVGYNYIKINEVISNRGKENMLLLEVKCKSNGKWKS